MWNWAVDQAVDLLMEQYQDMTDRYDTWEMDYLTEEGEKGMEQFESACKAVFGVRLVQVLHLALEHAHELNEHAYSISDTFHDDESKEGTVMLAQDIADASSMLLTMLEKQNGDQIAVYREFAHKIKHYAKKIKEQLDPHGELSLGEARK